MPDSPEAHEPATHAPDGLGPGSAVHENGNSKPAARETESPLAEIPEPDHPEPAPHANPEPSQAVIKHPRWIKCRRPITKYKRSLTLGVIGLIAGVVAFFLYPRVPEAPTPGYSQLVIRSNAPIGLIEYAVAPVQGATKIEVRVQLAPGGLWR
jgi:hypothetical protein